MLFNSIEFFIFFIIVFFTYWFLLDKKLYLQNLFILISSYSFYAWWDWRFLFLILFSTCVDYICAKKIYTHRKSYFKKRYLSFSIIINIGILLYFKYFNFFVESWIDLMMKIGFSVENLRNFNIILPVGISFYTFQTISYSLDVYYGKIKPSNNFISFASFVSFFPQLVAGPIERANNLMPQILKKRIFKVQNIKTGLNLIFWGLFKKIVIADSLGAHVDFIFKNYQVLNGGILFIGMIYFSFQLYCDFSGYSDIAIGSAKLLGFELISNFKYPFFSTNPVDFWNRWHISLSSWIRDYLYNPIAIYFIRNFNYPFTKYVPHIITMLIIGLWHGANWTFVFFGLYWGLTVCIYLMFFKNISNVLAGLFFKVLSIFIMFLISSLSFLIFRSQSVNDFFSYLSIMINSFEIPKNLLDGFFFILIIIVFDYLHRKDERLPLDFKTMFCSTSIFSNYCLKTISYFSIISIIFWFILIFTLKNQNQFLYFQF